METEEDWTGDLGAHEIGDLNGTKMENVPESHTSQINQLYFI